MALMGSGSASGEDRAIRAVKEAFASPLLNDVDPRSAKNVLINITSGKEKGLSMAELAQVMDCIKDHTGGVTNFKRGVVCDPAMGDAIHITIVATGFNMSNLPIVSTHQSDPVEVVVLGESLPRNWEPKRNPSLDEPYPIGVGVSDRLHTTPSPTGIPKVVPVKKSKPTLILEPGEKITDLENTPAFVRQRIKIEEEKSHEMGINRLKMEERDGKVRLISDNSYIHQTQD